MSQQAVPADPHEMLYLPFRRRFTSEYATTPEGSKELRLFFGIKEISFDEPDLFSFGETLIQQDQFMAGSATTWSAGEPYDWERVKGLLETLLAEGILSREATRPSPEKDFHRKRQEVEARREAPTEPLWWNPDCPRLMERLTGRPLELGFLETVLPVHRIPHPALDQEGRQVGEMNVFPEAMRLRLPPEWRVCPYPGTRYWADALMNVTALRSMTRHWKPMLRGVLAVREEYLRRYPLRPGERLRLGDLHAMCYAVLALPALLLMRGNAPVANGELEPVLSSMFRVTDGVRMVAAHILYLHQEPRTYDTPVTAAELLHMTERKYKFISTRGVCAGPPHLVDEFLVTLLDGKPVTGTPPPVPAWDADIPLAMDYALRGMQLNSLQLSLWNRMCHAYDVMRSVLLEVRDEPGGLCSRLRDRLERDWALIQPTGLASSSHRDWVQARYLEIFDQAWRGLRGVREDERVRLQDVFTPSQDEVDGRDRLRLRELLHSRAGSPSGSRREALDIIADTLAEFLEHERSTLRAMAGIQRRVNALLQRPHPERRFSSADLALHLRLRTGTLGALPYLPDVLRDELGILSENTEDSQLASLHSLCMKRTTQEEIHT